MSYNHTRFVKATTFVTKGDRTRLTYTLLTTMLLHQAGAALSNTAIARMTGTSVHQVTVMRKLMIFMGTLGTVTDRPLPILPKVPETTWGEFHSVLMEAKDLCENAEAEGIDVPTLSPLRALIAAGEALRDARGTTLLAVAGLTDALRTAWELADEEYHDALPPLTPEEIADMWGDLARRLPAGSLPFHEAACAA